MKQSSGSVHGPVVDSGIDKPINEPHGFFISLLGSHVLDKGKREDPVSPELKHRKPIRHCVVKHGVMI